MVYFSLCFSGGTEMYQTKQVDVRVAFEIKESKRGAISELVMKKVLRYLLLNHTVTSVMRDYFILDSSSIERCFTLYKEGNHCSLDCEITSDDRDWYNSLNCDIRSDKSIVLDSIDYDSFNCI